MRIPGTWKERECGMRNSRGLGVSSLKSGHSVSPVFSQRSKELLSWVHHLTSTMFFAICSDYHLPTWWNFPTALSSQACKSTLLPTPRRCSQPMDVRGPMGRDSESYFATELWARVCQGLWKRSSPLANPSASQSPFRGPERD